MHFPAFFISLGLLFGIGYALYPHWIYVPLLLLSLLKQPLSRIAALLLLALSAYIYTTYRMPPPITKDGQANTGILSIDSIQPYASPFQKSLLYKAHFNNVACVLFLPQNTRRPLASSDYLATGVLNAKEQGLITFKPTEPLKELSKRTNLVEWRYKQKEALRHFLKKRMPDKKAAHFLSALLTGDVDDRELKLELRKVGLSHLLAVSGFHFALLVAFAGLLLKIVFPQRIAQVVLLLLTGAYFCFLGVTPSILRAFIAIGLYLIAKLFDLQAHPLNLLGCAFIGSIIYDPLSIQNPGFQLTFLCTLGLLLFYRPTETTLCYLLPKRSIETLKTFSFFDQHMALLAGLIRRALAACLAAHVLALPICLFHFHSFPWLSILYNLFFPFACGVSLLVCLIGILLGPLGGWLLFLDNYYTGFLLRLIDSAPALINYSLHLRQLPFACLIAVMFSIFYLCRPIWRPVNIL